MKAKRAEVISHWYSLIPGFSMPTNEFYVSIEQELKARDVPNLEIQRVEFAEGGILSANRKYLRMQREMLVFDVCAAPFGKGYFFSCRFAEIPAPVTLWQILGLLTGLFIFFLLINRLFLWWGPFVFIAACAGLYYVLRNALSLGLKDLDATLIKSPLLGALYLRFFRRETYYRHDTRLMYCDTINEIVKEAVQQVTGAKGLEMIRMNEYDPLLSELYKPRFVKPTMEGRKP